MSQKLAISDTGLKLIKAFEGYRPVDRELVTGQRIVGYGHRLYSEDAVMMDKGEAEETLLSDLEPFEDMINTEVHAPITQSQFDALCSFAFNIGPKAFLKSDTLRALNNGRPLDAANGLDIWRKSEIAGKTYVVDALMRRRTAEKALFLRTARDLPAGREDLPPVKDTTIEGLSTEDALPVFTEEDARAVVASAPYSAAISPARRREDGVAGTLELSELDIIEEADVPEEDDLLASWVDEALNSVLETTEDLDLPELADVEEALEDPFDGVEMEFSSAQAKDEEKDEDRDSVEAEFDDAVAEFEDAVAELGRDEAEFEGVEFEFGSNERRQSPIAAAASDIVARLDRLIDDVDAGFKEHEAEWPKTLVPTDEIDDKLSAQYETLDEVNVEPEIEAEPEVEFAPQAKVIDLKSRAPRSNDSFADAAPAEKTPVLVIDEMAADDPYSGRVDSASKYIENSLPEEVFLGDKSTSPLGLWIPVILGFVLLGAAGGTLFRGAEALLGAWGPIIAFTGFVIGIAMILAGIYAALRINAQK